MHLSAMYSTVACILIVIKVLKNDLCHKRVLIEPPYLQFNQTLKLLMPFRIGFRLTWNHTEVNFIHSFKTALRLMSFSFIVHRLDEFLNQDPAELLPTQTR